MKKRRILFLVPFAALLLGGCSFEEVWAKIAAPFQNIFKTGDKNAEKSEKETKEDSNQQNSQSQNQGEGQQGGNQQGSGQQGGGDQGGNEQGSGQQGGGDQGGNEQGSGQQGGGQQGGGEQGGGEQTVNATITFDFGSDFSTTSGKKSYVSFTSDKGDGASAPAYIADSSEFRLYISNTLTISADYEITSISFDANTCTHSKADGTLSATPGKVSKVTGGFSWTGSAKSVTFTVDSGKQVHINSFTVVIGEGGEQGGSEGGGSQTYTVESVVADLEDIFMDSFTNQGDYYVLGYDYSEENVDYSDPQPAESVLKPVVDDLLVDMPDYLELEAEHYWTAEEDYWEDGSGDTAYNAYLTVDDVVVELLSYCYDGDLNGCIYVYED